LGSWPLTVGKKREHSRKGLAKALGKKKYDLSVTKISKKAMRIGLEIPTQLILILSKSTRDPEDIGEAVLQGENSLTPKS